MSEPDTNTKTSLWKQFLGALAGATVAFMLFQAYAFTSVRLEGALVGNWHPRPSGTLGFPNADAPATEPLVAEAQSSSFSAATAQSSSSVVRTVSPEEFLGTTDTADTAVTAPEAFENPYADAPTPAVAPPDTSSSAAAEPVVEFPAPAEPTEPPVPVEPLSEPIVPADAAVAMAHAGKLPQTGFGLDLIAFTTLGALIGSRRSKNRACAM